VQAFLVRRLLLLIPTLLLASVLIFAIIALAPGDPARMMLGSQATPEEIATHLQDALKWVEANPCVAEANTIQIYAWNEITEGGWLLPSNPALNPVGAGRLNAIANVLRR